MTRLYGLVFLGKLLCNGLRKVGYQPLKIHMVNGKLTLPLLFNKLELSALATF